MLISLKRLFNLMFTVRAWRLTFYFWLIFQKCSKLSEQSKSYWNEKCYWAEDYLENNQYFAQLYPLNTAEHCHKDTGKHSDSLLITKSLYLLITLIIHHYLSLVIICLNALELVWDDSGITLISVDSALVQPTLTSGQCYHSGAVLCGVSWSRPTL